MSALLLWLLNDLALGRLRDAAMAVAGVARRVNCEFGDRDAGRNHKVREAETRASNLAAPATLAEKSVHRKREPLCANKRCWLMIWHSRLLFSRESLPGTRIGGAKEINEGA